MAEKITCWVKNLNKKKPMKVYWDNLAAISIAKNPVLHGKTKHVELDRNFTKEKAEAGILNLIYTFTHHQGADVLTKALPRLKFNEFTSKLGMIDIYSPAWGEVWNSWFSSDSRN